jgi:hypothetical protein
MVRAPNYSYRVVAKRKDIEGAHLEHVTVATLPGHGG